MLDDEVLAQFIVQMPEQKHQRPLREWSPELEALATVSDRLLDVLNVLLQVNGNDPSDIKRLSRPVTAIDRVREKQRRIAHESLVARVLNREGGES